MEVQPTRDRRLDDVGGAARGGRDPEELVQQELDALRESIAELAPADERPAREGDAVVVDLAGEERPGPVRTPSSSSAPGRLVDEIESALVGASVGETRHVEYELADGGSTAVDVTVKHVNEKVLPPVDDELARSASEFDTLADLRADIEQRIRQALDEEIETAFRAAAVDTLVDASGIRPAGPLVETRARSCSTASSARSSGAASARDLLRRRRPLPEELTAQLRAEAALSVARELALEAVADRAGIHVADDDVKELIAGQAEAAGDDPEAVIDDVWAHGQRRHCEDLRLRRALDQLAAEVKPISADLAEARERLWTPDKEKTEPEQKLWTPAWRRIDEPADPDGDRADVPRRAIVRHLLASAQRADHLPGHARRRPDREPDHRPAAPPRVEDPDKPISLYVNSPGGAVYSGLAIYDTMQFIKPDVSTICVRIAMSMGALLLAGGAEGKRMALPNSKILIHQVWGGYQGQASDIEIHARETISLKRRLEEIMARHTGQDIEKVRQDMDRDFFMTSEEAKEYGIIDQVLVNRSAVE